MNNKLAKKLRKEAGYHHTVPVKYVETVQTTGRTTISVDPSCAKGRYKALKKQAKQ